MDTLPHVGIIVLNYNGAHCLLACLESLQKTTYSKKEIIVVDNKSTDTSLVIAKERFPQCVFIQNETNDGFSKGMNKGIRVAIERGAQWCWIFNYDAIAEPQALTELMRVVSSRPSKRIGLLSPMIYQPDGSRWFAKGRINFLRMRAEHILPTKRERASVAYPSEFVTGCALLISGELVRSIGFLDERFFLYYEDADYSRRATEANFLCLVVPQARVTHYETSPTSDKKTYFLVYSGLLFFKKWESLWMRVYFVIYGMLRRIKNYFDRVQYPRSQTARAVHLAYKDFYAH